MHDFSRSHLTDQALLEQTSQHLGDERQALAKLLADLAEIDARSLYLAAGYSSMHVYCVQALHLSDQEAYDRTLVASVAHRFPALFLAIAEGRVHLTGARRLASHLTAENADTLIAAASFKTKGEIEELIASWFPRIETPAQVAPAATTFVPEQNGGPVSSLVPEQNAVPARVDPVAPDRFTCQFTMDRSMRDKLEYAKSLLGHSIPSGDLVQLFSRALDALIARAEKRKFAPGARLKAGKQANPGSRSIPAAVRAQVWERDGGQCTYVSESDHRCEERTRLEFDHIVEFARGGEATVDNLRLRCRGHNQYAAERTYGRELMRRRREASRRTPVPPAVPSPDPARREIDRDLLSALRNLGYRNGDTQRALAHCATLPLETLEAGLRAALVYLRPPARTQDFACPPRAPA